MLICAVLGLLVPCRGVSRADGIEIAVDTATRLEGSWRLSAGGDAQAEARRGQGWMIFDLVPENLLRCRRYSDPSAAFVEFRDGFGMSWDPTPEPDWVGRTPVYYATAWAVFTALSGSYYPRLTGGPDVAWEFWDVRWDGEGSEFSGRFRFVAVPVPWRGEVKWRQPVANAVFSAPTPIVLEASVSVQVGTVAFVRFFSGTTLLGSVEEPPYLIRWKNAPEGEHELVASVVDDRNQERASDRVHIMVGPSNGEPATEVRVLDAVVGEAPGASTSLQFEVSLSKTSSEPVTVRYETVAGSATAGTDYLGTSGTLVFEPGVTSLTVEVTVLPDEASEPDEALVLSLSEPIGAILGRAQAAGVIQDDPGEVARTVSLPILSVADTWVTVEEPGIAGAEAQFRARLSLAGSRPVRVTYTTVDGTADVTDYTPVSGTLLFPPGTTEQIVSVPVAPNALGEADEWFGLELSYPEECHLATRRATCQVSDEYPPPTEVITIVTDGPLPALSVRDATVRERIGGSTNLTFNVWLSRPASVPVEFYYVTEGDTALPEADFVADSGWIRMETGATNALIPVAVLADDRSETAETLRLRLAAPEEAVLARKAGTGTILDRYNLTPTVLLLGPANGSTFKYGEPVAFSGLAYDPEGRIAGVEFLVAGTVVGAASGSPFTASNGALPLGRHPVSARVVDETGAASSSDDIWIEVVESSPFTWVVPPPGSTLRVGEATRLAVRLDLIDIELRQVEFFVNGHSLGAADAPILELNWTPEAAGIYTVRAVGWDLGGSVWTSDPLAVSVMVTAPLNDNFAEAVSLEGFRPHVEATNEGAGRDPGEPLHHAVESGGSLWYRWTSPGDGLATIRVLGPERRPGIAGFYTGTQDGPLAPVRVITGTGTLAVTTGQGYWIMLDTFGGDRGSIQFDMVLADARWSQPADGSILDAPLDLVLQVAMNAPAEAIGEVAYFAGNELLGVATEAPFSWPWTNTPCGYHELRARVVDVLGGQRISPSRRITVRPGNDDFEQATVVNGHRVVIRASNEAATYQGAYVQQPPPRMDAIWIGEPRYGDNQGGHSIWYQWRAPEDGLCKVEGDIAGTGALLAVYVGARVDQLRFVGSNPFEPRGTSLLFPVTAGTNYYIAFDGLFSEEGPIEGGIELHPMNDDFERRVRVGSDRFEAIASHRGASLEGAVEAALLGNPQEVSVWWEWTPPNSSLEQFK